jgi:hypothetical protein
VATPGQGVAGDAGMVLRLLMTGLCTACVVMLATFQPFQIEVVRPAESPAPSSLVSVVDVVSSVPPHHLPALLRLGIGEWVSAINDRPIGDGMSGEAQIGELALYAGQYLDLTVSGETRERRILVLVH